MLKQLGALLIAHVMFRVAPEYIGRQAFRGMVINRGVDPLGLPLAFCAEVAADNLQLCRRIHASGLNRTPLITAYTLALESEADILAMALHQPHFITGQIQRQAAAKMLARLSKYRPIPN